MSIKKKYMPIVKIAFRRRDHWPNREKAKEYFISKKVFKRFNNDVLDDFVQDGLIETEGGVRLAFPREWEGSIYASGPFIYRSMKKSRCKVTFIKAQYSDVITSSKWKEIKLNVQNAEFVEVAEAGHLLPFEDPSGCADIIASILKKNAK